MNLNSKAGQILPLTAVIMAIFAVGIFSLGQLGNRAVNIATAEATAEIIVDALQTHGIDDFSELTPELVKKAHEIAGEIARANSAELLNLQNSEDNQSVIVEIEYKGRRVSLIVGR